MESRRSLNHSASSSILRHGSSMPTHCAQGVWSSHSSMRIPKSSLAKSSCTFRLRDVVSVIGARMSSMSESSSEPSLERTSEPSARVIRAETRHASNSFVSASIASVELFILFSRTSLANAFTHPANVRRVVSSLVLNRV